jgi:hypothetical protein
MSLFPSCGDVRGAVASGVKNPPGERREPRRPRWEAPERGAPRQTRLAAWASLPAVRYPHLERARLPLGSLLGRWEEHLETLLLWEYAPMDALATDKEVATYSMLKQVLQNHLAAAHLPLVTAADVVFGSLCELCVLFYIEERNAQGPVTEDTRCEIDIPGLVAQQTGPLKRSLRARLAQPVFTSSLEERGDHPEPPQKTSTQLSHALRRLLHEASGAYGFDRGGGLRIMRSLLADLLSSVFIHARAYTVDEVDRIIDERMGPGLDSYITMQAAALSPPWRKPLA